MIKGTHYDDSRSGDGDAEEVEDEEEEKVILRENDGINLFKLLNLLVSLSLLNFPPSLHSTSINHCSYVGTNHSALESDSDFNYSISQ